MTTLKSTSILASIIAQNPYHIVSIQGQMPMSHAQNTYDFEIAMTTRAMAFPTNKFQPKTVWEHYCKYTLHIHPSQATEDQYDYFLDCWSGDDEYQYLYDYYEKKYPEYNNQLKHYGK